MVGMNFPEASIMMAKEMIQGGYKIGKGLERNLQGVLEPIEFQGKKDTFGLGFQPTVRDRKEMLDRNKVEKEGKQIFRSIPPLYYIFPHPSELIRSELDPIDEVDISLSKLFMGVTYEGELLKDPEFSEISREAMKNWTVDFLPSRREFR